MRRGFLLSIIPVAVVALMLLFIAISWGLVNITIALRRSWWERGVTPTGGRQR